jgi:uncharacterized Fe-S center protein
MKKMKVIDWCYYEAEKSCGVFMVMKAWENCFTVMFTNEPLTYAHFTMDYMYSMVLIEQTIVASGKIDTRKNNRPGENGN